MSDDRILARKAQAIWIARQELEDRYNALELELFTESQTASTGLLYELLFNSTDDNKPPSIEAIVERIREVHAWIAEEAE